MADISKDIIIKSTILPGTTRYFADKYTDLNFIFSPEFLVNRTARYDYSNPTRIILGGEELGGIERIYRRRFSSVPIHLTDWESAELVKYMNNCYYAYKVSFLNEFREIANEFGIEYNDLRTLFLSDQIVSNSFTEVPGYDGKLGYGGKCLTKDTKAFIRFCELNNMPIDSILAANKINNRVRFNKK
jgi:UDPglucose 6-dehydrogenase